jgi:hypothetical protein
MFDVIRKDAYWAALDDKRVFQKLGGFTLKALDGLKHIQDAWTLHRLHGMRDAKVIEVGGGVSRVLPALDDSNERWNLDDFGGDGNGVTEAPDMPSIRLVREKMGSFSGELPDRYFDLVFSISVIEHLPYTALEDFWRDHARIMKPGATAVHTIDLYLGDEPDPRMKRRLEMYVEQPAAHGLVLVEPAKLPPSLAFRCDMASNSDWGMWRWNKNVPTLESVRRVSQSVSLALVLRREV